jgi:hypothetical protein
MHTKAIMFYLDDRKDLCIRKKYEIEIHPKKKEKRRRKNNNNNHNHSNKIKKEG